jgi:hypothetical protein
MTLMTSSSDVVTRQFLPSQAPEPPYYESVSHRVHGVVLQPERHSQSSEVELICCAE